MIGAPLPPSLSLHLPASPLLRPASAPGLAQPAHAAAWLEAADEPDALWPPRLQPAWGRRRIRHMRPAGWRAWA